MSKRKQNTIAFKRENLINRLRILLIAVLTIITFYPPYLQGLYFEKHVLPTQIIVFVTFIVFLIYKLLKKDYTFFRTPIDYACLGFVIVYFISIFVAVHTRSAIIEWLKYCMCFAVFYMISDLADNQKTKLLFLWTIIISAFGVSVIGLDAAFGGNFVRILNKFFNQLGVKGDLFFGLYSNNRIHSTLQYANALASYLMAVFFVTVGLLMFYNKWWQNVILGIFAYILFVTFMLTQSRGIQFLFPLVVIILFIAAPKGNRIKTLTCTLLLAITAGVAALFIAPYLSENYFNKKVLLPLLIGLFITILISMVIKDIGSLLQKIDWRIYLIIISAIVITFTVGAIYLINSSEPVELSLLNSAENKIISISKDVALKSNKNYILKFEAEGKMTGDKPYVFMVKLNSKNLNDILFGYSSQLTKQEFTVTNGLREFSVSFYTNEDTKLVNVDFSIYYSGTYVKINNISIIDKDSGKIVKKVALKNKYDLDNIISRFQNLLFQRSLILRIVYYKDGFNMFKDRWLLGAGGGAWNYLYRQYQSYNYASSQAHNYPLQVGIETGILGIFNLMFLVIVLIIYYKKYYKKDYNNFIYASIFSAILALFMHSIIDFDFAESSMLLLFWSFIALFNSELIDKLEFKDFKLFDIEIKRNDYNKKNIFLIIAGILFSGVTLYFSSAFFNASLYAKQSFESFQNGDIENAINKMEKAINWDRYNETYVIGYNPVQTKPDIKAGLIDILFTKNEIYNSVQNESGNISDTELKIFQNQFFEALLYLKNIEKKLKII
ncbi:O-antigen ligase family protein [Thermoclostridium stercorarium]|uniref:O-antigen ligase family protein n=1 Tax=Thermoclostridium stercorarium TaxID=1510 RepID=UPI002248C3DD|nr:O-antigen ligase family protein [Thermoclostridium stercorarium]UZQ85763.1 O-antigen ligase family protein [Thermoclostridium stercorarium]